MTGPRRGPRPARGPAAPASTRRREQLDAEPAPGTEASSPPELPDLDAIAATAGAGGGADILPLYTPGEAAQLLSVRESWLRRRAAERSVACTFLGKHLRFSHTDVVAIATAGARPTDTGPPRRRPRTRRR